MTIQEHVREAEAKLSEAKLALHNAKNEAWQSARRVAKMLDPYENEGFKASLFSDLNRLADAVQREETNLRHAKDWLAQVQRLAREETPPC